MQSSSPTRNCKIMLALMNKWCTGATQQEQNFPTFKWTKYNVPSAPENLSQDVFFLHTKFVCSKFRDFKTCVTNPNPLVDISENCKKIEDVMLVFYTIIICIIKSIS